MTAASTTSSASTRRSRTELAIYRRIDKTILQNMDWIAANQDSLSQWLVDNLPAPGAAPKMYAPLPSSPLELWNSLSFGSDEKE
jgi:hypothetical protein